MDYVRLGRTGLRVSRLCLGTMNFGPLTGESDGFAIMDRALELGIVFFDTADVYGWRTGEGVTEQIIGRWLAQGGGRRERIVLATKVYGRMGPGPNDGRLSASHIRQACERHGGGTQLPRARVGAERLQPGGAHDRARGHPGLPRARDRARSVQPARGGAARRRPGEGGRGPARERAAAAPARAPP